MSKIKILCTGSGGFIFSNFVRQVLKLNPPSIKAKYEVIGVDKCVLPKVLNTIYTNKGHRFHIGDVVDKHFMNVIFELERPDIVIHGAAESFVDDSITDATKFVRTNVEGTQVIIDMCVKWDVKRCVYISANHVYGHLTSEDEPAWNENTVLNPRNPCSATKAAGEMLIKAAHETYGLPYNIIRACNNYGPRQPVRNLIPKIIANINHDQPVPIYGQGMQIRDWIHVQDNCSAIIKIIEDAPLNEIYNVSAKQEYTNIEVFHEVCNILGRGHSLLKFVDDRKGHDFRYSADNTKLLKLGWEPKFKFKPGIEHTIDWYMKNTWFMKDIECV